jgi:hypothetical protein
MRMCVLRDRDMTSNIVAQRVANVRQTNVSSRTVRRRLKSFGLTSRKPATAPLLLPHHRRARLNFAMEHTYWTEEQWGSVLFTDESRFTLRSPDGRDRVWRRQGELGVVRARLPLPYREGEPESPPSNYREATPFSGKVITESIEFRNTNDNSLGVVL